MNCNAWLWIWVTCAHWAPPNCKLRTNSKAEELISHWCVKTNLKNMYWKLHWKTPCLRCDFSFSNTSSSCAATIDIWAPSEKTQWRILWQDSDVWCVTCIKFVLDGIRMHWWGWSIQVEVWKKLKTKRALCCERSKTWLCPKQPFSARNFCKAMMWSYVRATLNNACEVWFVVQSKFAKHKPLQNTSQSVLYLFPLRALQLRVQLSIPFEVWLVQLQIPFEVW